METVINDTKKMLKPKRTLIEVEQAIQNITRQNIDGRYNERLLDLSIEKLQIQIWIKDNTQPVKRIVYKASPNEEMAIMAFNSDKIFKITE